MINREIVVINGSEIQANLKGQLLIQHNLNQRRPRNQLSATGINTSQEKLASKAELPITIIMFLINLNQTQNTIISALVIDNARE